MLIGLQRNGVTMTNSSKSVFDVSKPNNSAPTPTSRPVITQHGPMMKDPMVATDIEEEKQPKVETSETQNTIGEKVIAPLNQPAPESKKPDEAPKPEKATEDISKDKNEAEAAIVSAVAEQAGKKKKGGLSKEETARQAELEKLIEEKKYYVPIGQVKHRRHKRLFWTFFIFVLVLLAGSYLAIDANLIDLGIELPYEFIN